MQKRQSKSSKRNINETWKIVRGHLTMSIIEYLRLV